jgi:aromatic-L-amino-acid/L-tryptophan decarboxylase
MRWFRALKVWLLLRCYGVEGLRGHVLAHVRMAASFESMVKADARFEVTATRQFALVCFRLRSPEKLGGEKAANELNRRLLEEVNAAGSGPYMSSAMVGGIYMLKVRRREHSYGGAARLRSVERRAGSSCFRPS